MLRKLDKGCCYVCLTVVHVHVDCYLIKYYSESVNVILF